MERMKEAIQNLGKPLAASLRGNSRGKSYMVCISTNFWGRWDLGLQGLLKPKDLIDPLLVAQFKQLDVTRFDLPTAIENALILRRETGRAVGRDGRRRKKVQAYPPQSPIERRQVYAGRGSTASVLRSPKKL
jgi:hypothetical protein